MFKKLLQKMNDYLNTHKTLGLVLKTSQWILTSIGLIVVLVIGYDVASGSVDQKLKNPLIQSMPSGEIEPNSMLSVVFKNSAVDSRLVGAEESRHLIKISPDIEGKLFWSRQNTLSFLPEKPLLQNQTYKMTVFVNKVFPNQYNILPKEKASFTVMGQQLKSLKHHWKPVSLSSPDKVRLEGQLSFVFPTELNDVVAGVSFLRNGEKVELKLTVADSDGLTFNFESDVVDRKILNQTFQLHVDKKIVKLKENIKETIELVLADQFKPLRIQTSLSRINPKLQIDFSDPLKPQQDIRGLIHVKGIPRQQLQLKIVGQSIHVVGPFKTGKTYDLEVSPGISSQFDFLTKEQQQFSVRFDHADPQVKFFKDGYILPSTNQGKLIFETINLKRVRVDVVKVEEKDFGLFIMSDSLDSQKNRHAMFNTFFIQDTGFPLVSKTLDIDPEGNSWLQSELDLKDLIETESNGIYLISLSFTKTDMIFPEDGADQAKKYNGRYFQSRAVYKPIVLSDIGLTLKKAGKNRLIYVNDIKTGDVLSGVTLELWGKSKSWGSFDKKLMTLVTDANGVASFDEKQLTVLQKDRYYSKSFVSDFFVKAIYKDKTSYLSVNSKWNDSTFDTGGVDVAKGISAFIYSDRGVYRPGSTIYLSVISRDSGKPIPNKLPIDLKFYNPKNQLVYETTNQKGVDGFYSFDIPTKHDDLTGTWQAKLIIGSRVFTKAVKIETIVPYKLKINTVLEHSSLNLEQQTTTANIESRYLIGKPADGHDVSVKLQLLNSPKTFKTFQNYIFTNQTKELSPIDETLFVGKLNQSGRVDVPFTISDIVDAPSSIEGKLTTVVNEKGGRPVRQVTSFTYDPYMQYVGIEKLTSKYGYFSVNSSVSMGVVLLSKEGNLQKKQTLRYRIYQNKTYWWWEFQRRSENKLSYKQDNTTTLIKEGEIVTDSKPVFLTFSPEFAGVYFVEILAPGKQSHVASQFFNVSNWGDNVSGGDNGAISVRSEKSSYAVGEKATIEFPAPPGSKVLVSIEKGDNVLETFWYAMPKNAAEGRVVFPVTKEMVPNVYASISVIQPHQQTINDLPVRLFGITSIHVNDPTTVDKPSITLPKMLEPLKDFSVEIQSQYQDQSQFTIAIVDEGLLDITDFKTPDPSSLFFAKQRLGVTTYDTFGHIIGANKGDIYKTFSIGGADALVRRQEIASKIQRFKPLELFKGPFKTDKNGYAKVSFKMPQYVGSVRVMVIGAKGNRYASSEKVVKVNSPLMVVSSMPRILKTNDEFDVTISVVSGESTPQLVALNLDIDGPLSMVGESLEVLTLEPEEEKVFTIRLKVDNQVGVGAVKIIAKSDAYKAVQTVPIEVKVPAPHVSEIHQQQSKTLKKGESFEWMMPAAYVVGSDKAYVTISKLPNLSLTHRLKWLIRYPYGCIEQTTSSVFPQLYLKDLLLDDNQSDESIDRNLNLGIDRIKTFQTTSGGFSYWPGGQTPSPWGTNYAGHFLILAKKQGYFVPDSLLNPWVEYQKKQAYQGGVFERVYRVYLLALYGEPQMGAMNQLVLNEFKNMRNPEKWMLAAAYALAGDNKQSEKIIKNATFSVPAYTELGRTYGSALRDKAMILGAVLDLKNVTLDPVVLVEDIAEKVSQNTWYSTQTLGYSLMSLGRYLVDLDEDGSEDSLEGTITYAGNKTTSFSSNNVIETIPITEGFGQSIQVKSTNRPSMFVQINWKGVPDPLSLSVLKEKITVERHWFDDNGVDINIENLKQGDHFWAYFKVKRNNKNIKNNLEELALTQILPSGWEVNNTRLSGEVLPAWTEKFDLGKEDYLDIRDDRVSWFFDLDRNLIEMEFLVKLSAVTPGEYILAPTLAEAMYDHAYKSIIPAKKVTVSKP